MITYSNSNEKIKTQINIPSQPNNIVHIWVFWTEWENAIIKQINGPIIPDEIASHIPQETASDFPPLNFRNGEKILPLIAAKQININS